MSGICRDVLEGKAALMLWLDLLILYWPSSKIRNGNKFTFSYLTIMHNSRSDLTICPRNGCLIRFLWKRKAISNGSVLKLGNNIWHEFEMISTKVCRLLQMKRNVGSPRRHECESSGHECESSGPGSGCWNSLKPLSHFVLHWSCHWLDTLALYIWCALYNISEAIWQWQILIT